MAASTATVVQLKPNLPGQPSGPVTVAAVTLATATLTDVAVIQPMGRGALTVTCTTGTNAITALAITRNAGFQANNFTPVILCQGTNVVTGTPASLLEVIGSTVATTAAATSFQLLIDTRGGAEYKIQAAGGTGTNATSLAVEAYLNDLNS